MSDLDDITAFIAQIDTETTRIGGVVNDQASQIAALIAQIANGSPVTAAQLTAVRDALAAEVPKLQAIGAPASVPPAARKR